MLMLILVLIVQRKLRADLTYLRLCEWVDTGISREQYDNLRDIIREGMGVEIPRLRNRETQLPLLPGMLPVIYDCCSKSCIAYTGTYSDLTHCPVCETARWVPSSDRNCTKVAQQTFIYSPLAWRLQQQYLSRRRVRTMSSYVRPFFEAAFSRTATVPLQDWWAASQYLKLRRQNKLNQLTDIALQIVMDGLSTKDGWCSVVLVNYNLPPSIRYQKHNILLSLIIPSHFEHGNINSFLWPLVEELKYLGDVGVDAINRLTGVTFTLRAWPVVVTG
jgi:hypothetical protein